MARLFLLLLCMTVQFVAAQEESKAPGEVAPETVENQYVLRKVTPIYPPLARQARIQGTVILRIVIGKSGDVNELRLVSGHPMLAPAAIDAVRQWKYRPYEVNGEPVPVETNVLVNFAIR